MFAIILSTVFLLLITYVLIRHLQLRQYWSKRGVPHIPPHPVFGSLTFIQRENPAYWLRRMYDNFKAPYVGVWIFWRPALLINSEEIARNILIKDQANFRNRLANSGSTDPVGALNLFTLNDPQWTVVRKHLTPLFTGSKLRGIQNVLALKSKDLVERIDKDRQKPEPINLKNIMIDFSTDVTSASTFGVESNATLTGESYMRTITQGYTQYAFFRALSWCCIFFIPELVDFFRFKMFPIESSEYLRQILRTIIAQRGGLDNIVTDPRDLLDILIKLKQEDKDNELYMTEDMMLAQAAAFVQGGFETTAITLTFAIYELSFHPEAQDKLYKELQEAKDKHNGDILETGVLSQLTYLNCVIDETLRKYPILSWLDRIALEDYKVDDNLTIKAGTPVMVNVVGLQHDPDFYSEPEKFIPDRFLQENKNEVKLSFMPFGEGPRKCIGQRFGYFSVRHGLAAVILNYAVRPLPNAPKPSEINLAPNTMFISPGDQLSVEFIPRS